jgi:hypothetical protein
MTFVYPVLAHLGSIGTLDEGTSIPVAVLPPRKGVDRNLIFLNGDLRPF